MVPTYQTALCWCTPHLYFPLHHHNPLQPLTISTMPCHWFLSCAMSFKLLIPRICRCCSVTSNLLIEGLCLFLVCSGFVTVIFQGGGGDSNHLILKVVPLPLLCQGPYTAHTAPVIQHTQPPPLYSTHGPPLYSTRGPLLYSTHSPRYTAHTAPPATAHTATPPPAPPTPPSCTTRNG
jgi:hypothetical protein